MMGHSISQIEASNPLPARPRVTYLSPPQPVSMGDWWFDIATTEHFWMQRRFHVLRRMAEPLLRKTKLAAEIGCGNGLLQRQLEDHYGIEVAGFELNELALHKNVSRLSALYCYNIHDRKPEFHGRFDVLFLFDVLEHIDDESGFLQSVKFHLADRGRLLINVPAHQSLYSDYDRAAGHVRRYCLDQLAAVCEKDGLALRAASYWGMPLVPLLLLRKSMPMRRDDGRAGFDPRGQTINTLLSWLARCEPLPQRIFGTSVMAVLENRS